MHKTLIVAGLALASTATVAGPYAGLGYQGGAAKVEQGALRAPVVDGRTLDLSGSDGHGGLTALAGYRFSDTWSLELSWRRAGVEEGFELRQAGQDEEWEASVEGSHFTLAPVYRIALGERLALRTTAGLLYGDYDVKQSHSLDVENGPDVTLASAARGRSRFGGSLGVGLEYTTPWKFDVVAEVRHQRTSVLSHTGASVSAVYRF